MLAMPNDKYEKYLGRARTEKLRLENIIIQEDLVDKSKGKSKTGKREDEETLLIEKGTGNSAGKIDFSF